MSSGRQDGRVGHLRRRVGVAANWCRSHTRTIRVGFAVTFLLVAAALGVVLLTGGEDKQESIAPETVPPRSGPTVVTSQNPIGKLIAYDADGSLYYENTTYDSYYDVDPHPTEEQTVIYAAIRRKTVDRDACEEPCVFNVIETVNLSTGAVERLYARYRHRPHSSEFHDVDRIGPGRYLVADMAENRVFIVNTTTGHIDWAWDAQQQFDVREGGPYPGDWTHLNDVEQLPDGRIMVSMRNQDQVVFIDPESGTVQEEWTVGAEDRYEVMYEQHNPDYIPAANGGPAVVIADSQNQRFVEYQRVDGDWEQTWLWRDAELSWPRDADRLPNGNTLGVDSHGNRIVEIAPDGGIDWQFPVRSPYDVERLGTGDESAGGPSAAAADLASSGRTTTTTGGNDQQSALVALWMELRSRLPTKLVNSLLFILPPWIGVEEMFLALSGGGIGGLWIGFEVWRSRVRLRWPVYRRTE